MKFFSFASGLDLFGEGMRQAGHEQVGHAEIDKWSNLLNEKYNNKGGNYGDIRKIAENADKLPDFEIACAGLPCPAFSIAGKRTKNPFDQKDVGGDLFIHFCKIVEFKKPDILFLEQVKGVLSSGKWKGEIFSTMLQTLSDLGYDCQWQVLNSKDFGVPQNRERCFIIGHLRTRTRPEVFPFKGSNRKDSRRVGEDLSYYLDRSYWKGTNTLKKNRRQLIQVNKPIHSNNRVYDPEGLSPTLNTMQGGRRQPFVLTERRTEEARKIRQEHMKKTGKDYSPRRGKEIVQKKDGLVGTLTTSPTIEQTIVDGARVRRLTPLECFRLQGASDEMYFKAKELNIADTNLYKMIGNSVTVPVIKAIGERLWKDGS